jgi:hypothetical protein
MVAFFLPNLLTHRRNFRSNTESFFRAAAQAASTSAVSRNLLAFLIRQLLLFPADRLLPGQIPAQLHK